MIINVRLFAHARDLARRDIIEVDLPEGATVATLRVLIGEQTPALAGFVTRCAVAIDGDYAVDTDPVAAGAEVALIPPVSGGA